MKITKAAKSRIDEIIYILKELGMPKKQLNDRTALCLLALLWIKPKTPFAEAQNPLLGVTPVMDFCNVEYKIKYAPNSRETFRRYSIHQMLQAGLLVYNPDDDNRPTNSPNAVYQVTSEFLSLIHQFDTPQWLSSLQEFKASRQSLVAKYAKPRNLKRVPVIFAEQELLLSPGKHNELVRAIIEKFAPAFLPEAILIYVGDTQNKSAFVNQEILKSINLQFDEHNKFPDVVFYLPERDWLVLIESVTSHGPMDNKRYIELSEMFEASGLGIVYISAFRDIVTFAKYSTSVAWETEVWIEDNPDHLIHFNGSKFLGPYEGNSI